MKRTHTGWSAEEDARLLRAVQDARRRHAPLQSAFDAVARDTQRRPNSVRNRYYTALRGGDDPEPLFQPFSDDEADTLVRAILLGRAEGLSVRACTLRLAEGDTRRMLRYQNKYRALLKTDPHRVAAVRAALAAEGRPTPDPYQPDPHAPRVGRPPKTLAPIPASAIRQLLDALYEDLVALAKGDRAG